jgi:cyclopropane fatty-acyl-phospholipid synthase-like methyltransferase
MISRARVHARARKGASVRTPLPISPFIRKYIFPGADVPSLSEVFAAVEPTGLFVTDV